MTSVVVRLQEPGFHCWPDAPESRSYLRHQHRHMFHIEVSVEVTHSNRQIELHDLKDHVRELFGGLKGEKEDLEAMSCEGMAAYLAETVAGEWPGRLVQASVFEDGEVGASYSTSRCMPS